MDAEYFDNTLNRWLHRQPDYPGSHYHTQLKLWSSEVEMAQLTAVLLPGWVIIDWQHRGLGLSAKRAQPAASHPPKAAQLLAAIDAPLLHIQVQIILAPSEDWSGAYDHQSLAPDLLPVLDAGHAIVLNVSAQRDSGDWRIIQARQPPDDQPIADFAS